MNIQILNNKQKKEIEKKAEQQFGIKKLPYLLFKTNKGKIRGYSGNLSRDEIQTLLQTINIELNGIYLFNEEQDTQLRISHDAVSLFKNQITKNIIEVNEEQTNKFLHGEDIFLSTKQLTEFQNNNLKSIDERMLGINKKTSRATTRAREKKERSNLGGIPKGGNYTNRAPSYDDILASEVSGGERETLENIKAIVVLKFQDNLIGSGKLSQGRITNFVPKERRLKTRST